MNIISRNNAKIYRTQMSQPTKDIFHRQYVANALEQSSAERFCHYCHHNLANDHDVMGKLNSIGLREYSLIERFELGYADSSYLTKLPHRDTFEGAYERASLHRLNILNEISRLIFNGAYLFPLYYDIYHKIIGIYGYWVNPRKNGGHEHFTLWNNEGLGIFNKQSLDAYDEIILCHSPVDACQLIESGYDNTVAIMGNGETEEHYYELFKYYASINLVRLVSNGSVEDQTWKLHIKLALQQHGIEVRDFVNA